MTPLNGAGQPSDPHQQGLNPGSNMQTGVSTWTVSIITITAVALTCSASVSAVIIPVVLIATLILMRDPNQVYRRSVPLSSRWPAHWNHSRHGQYVDASRRTPVGNPRLHGRRSDTPPPVAFNGHPTDPKEQTLRPPARDQPGFRCEVVREESGSARRIGTPPATRW